MKSFLILIILTSTLFADSWLDTQFNLSQRRATALNVNPGNGFGGGGAFNQTNQLFNPQNSQLSQIVQSLTLSNLLGNTNLGGFGGMGGGNNSGIGKIVGILQMVNLALNLVQTLFGGQQIAQNPVMPNNGVFNNGPAAIVQCSGNTLSSDPVIKGDFSHITAQDLTSRMGNSPLAAHAQDYIDAGRQYGVDPRFLVAISQLETGDGTSAAFTDGRMNAMGISPNGGGPSQQASVRDSIMKGASYIKGYNANTISQVGAIYSPPGASNDPNGTNGGWPSHVGQRYAKLAC